MNKRTPSRIRLVPLAVAAVLALAACGGGDDEAATDTVPAADSAESGDDGLLAPRPIEITGSAGAAVSARAEAAPAASDMATDMMMPYRVTNFVAGDGLELPTNDVGYTFQGGATVTAEQVAQLATALGVEGEPQQIDDGYSTYWRVGPDDGTAPSLWVYEDAQLSWSYSSAWADQAVASGCAVAEPAVVEGEAVEGDAATSDVAVDPAVTECVTPEPPAGVPTADEAEARVREVMATLGMDADGYELEVYADEWTANVTAIEQLDGAFAGRNASFGFGGEGVLQYAGGQLADPVKVGPYPLVDLDTAIARLNDPSGFYGGFAARLGMPDIAMVDSVGAAEPALAVEPAVEPSSGAAAGSPGEAPATMLPVTPLPDEVPQTTMLAPEPAPEEVTVTLVDVEADVWWAYDVDGSVWLLPAYRFIGDDGGWYTVPAVTDEFLIQAPAPETVPVPEPMPVESLPTESFPEDNMELFDTTPLQGLVGSSLADFTAEAEALGATVRVIEIDGVPQAATMDYNTMRVNVAVTGEGDAAVVTGIVNVG